MVLFSRDLWNDAAAAAAVTRRTYTKNEIFQVQYHKKWLRNSSNAKKKSFSKKISELYWIIPNIYISMIFAHGYGMLKINYEILFNDWKRTKGDDVKVAHANREWIWSHLYGKS